MRYTRTMSKTTSTESSNKSVSPAMATSLMRANHQDSKFYGELAKVTALLFVGTLALMTYLLSVGLQHPKVALSRALYASFGALAAGLVMFAVGHVFRNEADLKLMTVEHPSAKGEELTKLWEAAFTATARLRIVRLIQVLVFVIAVIAVAYFAFTASKLFFDIAATQSAAPAATPQ